MNNIMPKNTNQIIRDTFIDMALYLEALFFLYGVSDIMAEDIIHCLEDGYGKAKKKLKKTDVPKPVIKRKTAVDRFLKRLEQEGI